MTRRERLEAKQEKREEWAEKAEMRAAGHFDAAHRATDGIPLGQPILVGHHSEGHHRRALERADGHGFAGVAEMDKAHDHASKAVGLAHQLDRSVFSDDPDAVEALEARIVATEERARQYATINKAWRKGGREAVTGLVSTELTAKIDDTMRLCPWLRTPLDTTNLRASIRRDRERIVRVHARQQRQAATDAAGGLLIERRDSNWCRVTFAERPVQSVLDALRTAGYHWGDGAWHGEAVKLPVCVGSVRPMPGV